MSDTAPSDVDFDAGAVFWIGEGMWEWVGYFFFIAPGETGCGKAQGYEPAACRRL